MHRIVSVLLAAVVFYSSAESAEKVSLADLPKHAVEQSQLTLPGSQPFHLKAQVFESTDRDNLSHNAVIEEYWVAPGKWRRTVKANGFSEVLVVSGDKTSEELTGDYYPNWLRTFVNGIFDPGALLQGVNLSDSGDIPRGTLTPQGGLVIGDVGAEVCRRFTFMASNPPVTNKVFSSFCFNHELLESIGLPGYDISYKEYKKFGDKQVARKLGEYIEPGTELEADITEIDELSSPDETMFAVRQANQPLQTFPVAEQTLRGMVVAAPDVKWPTLTSGRNPGTLSIYVCVDRQGHVRETYPLNSDNPIMTAAAREQVMKWQFKPGLSHGVPVQMESILTFGYSTTIVPAK